MAGSRRGQGIPTQLGLALFEQFVLPHLSVGSRGPAPKLGLFKIFNYVLQLLYLGCQWKELPIDKDGEGHPEIHYTRIYSAWRRWEADGCIDAIFAGAVMQLHHDELLDVTVIHGDGTTTAAKKGGDNIGFNGHKKLKGDKVVATVHTTVSAATEAIRHQSKQDGADRTHRKRRGHCAHDVFLRNSEVLRERVDQKYNNKKIKGIHRPAKKSGEDRRARSR